MRYQKTLVNDQRLKIDSIKSWKTLNFEGYGLTDEVNEQIQVTQEENMRKSKSKGTAPGGNIRYKEEIVVRLIV